MIAARLFASPCLVAALLNAQAAPPAVDYDKQIHPILAQKCFVCHSQEKRSGGLSLFSYEDVLNGGRSGAAVRPGKSADSLLIQRVSGETQPRMPLGGEPLPASDLALIRAWIDEGARRTPTLAAAKAKWEAPLSLECPTVPGVTWPAWSNPLDRFTSAYLAAHHISEPQPVSDAVFARRAYLDIWGLLPSPPELRAFLKDRSADKRGRLVSTLLADNQKYSENWISYWNDLLRNDEGVSYHSESASRKSISKWLLTALQNNLPYDQFVYKLLNPTAPTDPEGFLVGVNWRGVVSASQTPAMQAAQNTAQIFLGINLKCNSCHDSFISKWKLRDAYSLAGYFSSEEKLQLYRCDVAQSQFAEPAFLYPVLNRTPATGSVSDRRSAAAAIFTDRRNGRLARTLVNRLWERLVGRGIVENSDEMDGEPWNPELLDWLASDFVDNHYDVRRLIGLIVSSQTYQMPSVASSAVPPKQYVFKGPEVRRLTAEEYTDAVAALTGDWPVYLPPVERPKSTVPGVEAALPPPLPGAYTRDWRVPANPLTRALGRPIRDQVFSTRDNQPTMLQGLELVNGETLTHWLKRGSLNMLGELPPEPAPVLHLALKDKGSQSFEIDISKAQRLWLLVADMGTYSPEKTEAIWSRIELASNDKVVPLSSLKPIDDSGLRVSESALPPEGGIRVKTPSRLVFDIGGKHFKTLRGVVALENKETRSEVSPDIRFFVFTVEPNMERLAQVAGEPPIDPLKTEKSPRKLAERLFWYALDRPPSKDELLTAQAAIQTPGSPKKTSPEGLADFLWALTMKPEFQLIY